MEQIPETLKENTLSFVGLIALVDPPRHGVKESIQSCYEAGVRVIMITEDNLWGLVMLKRLSDSLMKRIQKNYRLIIGINAGLIASGFLGFLAPGTSAFLHNASTLAISLRSMRKLLP